MIEDEDDAEYRCSVKHSNRAKQILKKANFRIQDAPMCFNCRHAEKNYGESIDCKMTYGDKGWGASVFNDHVCDLHEYDEEM